MPITELIVIFIWFLKHIIIIKHNHKFYKKKCQCTTITILKFRELQDTKNLSSLIFFRYQKWPFDHEMDRPFLSLKVRTFLMPDLKLLALIYHGLIPHKLILTERKMWPWKHPEKGSNYIFNFLWAWETSNHTK